MPHLRLEYPASLGDMIDMEGLCAALRDCLVETGLYPLGGIRVRGHAADCVAIADGRPGLQFLHMEFMIGAGRTDTQKQATVDALYAAAQGFIEQRLAQEVRFALSLELRELSPHAEKRWNTIHRALEAKADDA